MNVFIIIKTRLILQKEKKEIGQNKKKRDNSSTN